jgi:hypothetical protein
VTELYPGGPIRGSEHDPTVCDESSAPELEYCPSCGAPPGIDCYSECDADG